MAASLTNVVTPPTNNIATIKANYEIIFTTATTGTIKTISIAFPQGFSITSAILIERSGIGAGSLSLSGTTLTYSITSPVSIPSGTPIRLELAGLIQPSTPGPYTITITTKDSAGNIIDGPTTHSTYYNTDRNSSYS